MKSLLKWLVSAGALYLTVAIGQQLRLGLHLDGAVGALISVGALGLINIFVRPLVALLTLPLSCLTLGLFRFVLNALMFWLAGSLGLGLRVDGFVPALFGSIVLSAVGGILDTLIVERADRD
jgi:putative membrane protein